MGGEFKRTPLWRAAYATHESVVTLLLEGGGDPRLHDEDGCCPSDICQKDAVNALIFAWDLSKTDELVEEYEGWAEDQRLVEDFQVKEALRSVEVEFEAAKQLHEAAQKLIAIAKAEFRNREKEHAAGLVAQEAKALQSCRSAWEAYEKAEADAAAAQRRFDKANFRRLQAAEEIQKTMGKTVDTSLPGREVCVKDMNNVLLRDIGDRIADGSRWPLVVDEGELVQKMLVYAGCVVLNFWKAEDMQAERIRKGLLTMLRGGGIFAIDLFCFSTGVDRALLAQPFEALREGLFEELLSRSLLEIPKGKHWPRFHDLIRPDEKHKFGIEHFDEGRTKKFKFVVVTSGPMLHAELSSLFDVIRVIPSPD